MTGLTDAVFGDAVTTATLAPSMHNTQPWLFRRDGDTVDLRADLTRQLRVGDPHLRAVRIACGAALLNLRLALAAHGLATAVRLLPVPADPELLARLTVTGTRPPTPVETALYDVVPHRHSNREPFLDGPVPPAHRDRLRRAAAAEHCWLQLVEDPETVGRIAVIVRGADRHLTGDAAYRNELETWTTDDPRRRDGVPVAAGGPAPRAHELIARRDFGGPPHGPGRDYESDPLLAVLGSHGDLPGDQLAAGQALQRVLLTATTLGLSAAMISQPVDDPDARDRLWRELRWHGSPQLLLRLGYGLPAAASPRRPAGEVILR